MKNELERIKKQIQKDFNESKSFTISFICSGNIIRSPYAHILFLHMIANDSYLKKKINVESGGLKYRNSSISYEGREMLIRKGVSEKTINEFKPRYFPDYPDMFNSVDLILVMEKSHIKYLPKSVQDRAFLLLEFTLGIYEDVPDPYFDPHYERAYKILDQSLEYLLEFFRNSY